MQASNSPAHPQFDHAASLVLQVEDNDVDALLGQAAVAKAMGRDARVLRVGTLARGLVVARSSSVDLVLLDLNLPDSHGLDTLKRMRAATSCPIIVVTVEDAPQLDQQALAAGAFEILHKGKLGPDAIVRMLRIAEERRISRKSSEKALELEHSRLELALAANRLCTWDYDVAGGEIVLSEFWSEIIGAPRAVTRTTFTALARLVHPEDVERLSLALAEVMKGRRGEYAVEHRVRHADGTWRWIVSRGKVVIRDMYGRVAHMLGTNLDITEAKLAEDRLRQSEARFRSLSELSSDWFWEQDENFRFTAPSVPYDPHSVERASRLGKTRWELPGILLSQQEWAAHRATLDAHRSFRDFEYETVGANGERVWTSVSGVPLFDADGRFRGYYGIGRDVTERRRAEARLVQLARFDTVTGLPNRAFFEERLARQIVLARRHDRGTGVLFVDIDHFRLVNDSYGHQAGDELLARIGERLATCVRDEDTVARLSGDQFAIIIADLDRADDTAIVAQKIIDGFEAPFELDGRAAFISPSIGVATFPNDSDSAGTLLTCAETAMRRVKTSVRNAFCFFSPDMNARAVAKLHLHTDLHHALDRGEFRLHYQPKIDLASGATIGAEALLRWQHPARGMISPAEFIPALEDTGLIVPVGDWVIRQACSQLRAFIDQGLVPVPIAINLSAKQFRRRNLDQVIRELLESRGIAAGLLELEITESSLMDDPGDAIRQLQALRAAGFTISVDDFGTGYSSLAYLTRLPISTLKIDQTFVCAAPSEPASAAIVKMVIDMARTLGLNVVAEGIETDAHVAFLRAHGCEQGQGYHFGKPLPASALSARLARLA